MKIPSDWTFKNSEVAVNFNSHVREQLPWYELASGAVAHIVRHYAPRNGVIYDIGGSTGNLGQLLSEIIATRTLKYKIIDSSEQMKTQCNWFEFILSDACDFDYQAHDVSVLFLTLMFIDYQKRDDLLKRVYSNLNKGGALIIFDKLESDGGYISTIKSRLTIAGKLSNGASPAHIVEKELSLSGVQRPVSESFIYSLFPDANLVFKFGEFAGYIIEKK